MTDPVRQIKSPDTGSQPPIVELVAGLGFAILERTEEGAFRLTGAVPNWFQNYAPRGDGKEKLPLTELFPFLESFLPDAEDVWNSSTTGWLKSDLWTETSHDGREIPLQATAVKTGNQKFLVMESPEELYSERQAVVQHAHDATLQYDKAARLTRELAEANRQLDIRNQEVERATRAKSEFLARMSHEIRTPMNAIIGMADLLWETNLSADQRQYVEVFRRAGGDLLHIINDILDLSKVEAGHIKLEKINFDLSEVLERTVQMMAIRAHEKGLDLVCRVLKDVPAGLVGDPDRLRQTLINLIGNCIKFTDHGEVTLRVEPDPERRETGCLRFAISDTGIGIPKDKLGVIFESFSQADESTTRKYGGTGLGLTISKHFVELMDGRIWVESEIGVGSIFYFTARFGIIAEPPPPAPLPLDLGGWRILVVDDCASHRSAVREILSSWGALVTEAGSGEHALAELVRAKSEGTVFSLAMLDGRMPGMDGFQLAERILREPGMVQKIMLMLTTDRAADIGRCRELGIDGHLTKPATKSVLHESIANLLGEPKLSAAGQQLEPPVPQQLAPVRILLADDSEDNRFLIRSYLKNSGHHLDEATNGEIAVQKFQSGRYDLVLTDVQMPVMDGYTATRKMRAWESENQMKPTPILALTAHALKEEMQKSIEAGCDDHLTKPIRKATLLEAIDRYAAREASSHQAIRVQVDSSLEDIVPGFLENRKKDVATLLAAVEKDDFETVRVLGHNMKGTGTGYGFPEITAVGAALEAAGKSRNSGEARKRVKELSRYLEDVIVEFEKD